MVLGGLAWTASPQGNQGPQSDVTKARARAGQKDKFVPREGRKKKPTGLGHEGWLRAQTRRQTWVRICTGFCRSSHMLQHSENLGPP